MEKETITISADLYRELQRKASKWDNANEKIADVYYEDTEDDEDAWQNTQKLIGTIEEIFDL